MVCPQCGAEVLAEAIFCHKCGHRIAAQDVPSERVSGDTPGVATSAEEKFKTAVAGLDSGEEPERELWRGGYSPKAMIGAWCASAAISVVLLVIGILYVRIALYWLILVIAVLAPWVYNFFRLIHRRLSVRYSLTNQRFIHESGIFHRVSDRIEVLDIDDITFEQGIIERLVGVGTIRIVSSDRTHPELLMYGIDRVREVSGLFDDTRRLERRRRGLHIENI